MLFRERRMGITLAPFITSVKALSASINAVNPMCSCKNVAHLGVPGSEIRTVVVIVQPAG